MAKCLKAKKNYIVFFIHQKKYFSMHFGFHNQFIKVKKTLAKISKTTKNLFCFVLVSEIINLYVKCIFDIKKVVVFINDIKQLGFYPIRFLLDKIKISLQKRIFLTLGQTNN